LFLIVQDDCSTQDGRLGHTAHKPKGQSEAETLLNAESYVRNVQILIYYLKQNHALDELNASQEQNLHAPSYNLKTLKGTELRAMTAKPML
jgi:hypothetical protein